MPEFHHYIDSIFYQIEQTAKYCRQLANQTFQKLNLKITNDEFIVLDTIYLHNGICQRDLAKLILKDRPSTGRILNSLEYKGFVERYVDTKNNRLVRKMKLTDEGELVLKHSSAKLKQYIEKVPNIYSNEEKLNLINQMIDFRKVLEKEVELKI